MRYGVTAAVVCSLALFVGSASAQPATAPSDYPALRARLAELTALVEQLRAQVQQLQTENAALRQRVPLEQPANVQPNVSPRSTFTSRAQAYKRPSWETREVHQARLREAETIDAAIAATEATPEIKAAMYEGRIVVGMNRAQLDVIASTPIDVTRTADSESFSCRVKQRETLAIEHDSLFGVLMQNGAVVAVSSKR